MLLCVCFRLSRKIDSSAEHVKLLFLSRWIKFTLKIRRSRLDGSFRVATSEMKFLDRRETNESESICTKRFSLIKNESLRSCKQSDTFWLYSRGCSIWWIYGSSIPKRCLGLLKDSRRSYFYKGCRISIKSYELIILIVNNV